MNTATLCGYKYSKFDKKCKSKQNRVFSKCNPIYDDCIVSCATTKEAMEDAQEVAENAKDVSV